MTPQFIQIQINIELEETMGFYPHLLFFCSMIYFVMGVVVLAFDRKAVLNKVFFALNLSLFIWPFSTAFSTIASDKAGCILWSTIAALGYCAFSSISLHFFLIYSKREKFLKKWWSYVLIYLPAAILIFQAIRHDLFARDFFYNQFGWITIPNVGSVWFWLLLIVIGLSGGINIYLCYSMLKKSESVSGRKQAKIIFISTIISFLLGMVLVSVTKIFISVDIPDITVLALIVWILGILFAIFKYRLMILSPSLAAESILKTIIDSVVLVNPAGIITYVNSETLSLLKYKSKEIVGESFEILFPPDIKQEMKNIVMSSKRSSIRNKDTFFISKNNIRVPILFSASVCKDNDGNYIGFVALSRDITKIKDAEQFVAHLALHDALTNLPNRTLLRERLEQAMAEARTEKTYIAYILLDLDRFKEINDVYGHSIGDLLLIEVANRFTSTLRDCDMVARLGGDEFVILLSNLKNENDYETTIVKILECISKPIIIESHELIITASAGISIYPKNGIDSESLLKCADLAMYSAKKLGKNCYYLYDITMSTAIDKRAALEGKLRKSIINNELFLHYQPIIDIHTNLIIGIEALVRWNHPEMGVILPDEFIPIAEANGFINELGEWVLRTACLQTIAWQKEGLQSIYISVNISAHQFSAQTFVKTIRKILNETALEPENLMLEITQSTGMINMESVLRILTELNDLKIKVAIDDFGTDFSSLFYLRTAPIYAVKIDKCFIKDINNNSEYLAIVSATVTMAHSMNIKVIAEGIENKEQLITLQTLKQDYVGALVCDEGQGFLFSKPVSKNTITNLLKKQNMNQM